MDAGRLLHDARWMAGLTQAEVAQRAGISRRGEVSPAVASREWLRKGWPLATHDACVYLRGAQHLDGIVQRATDVAMPALEFPLLVASPDDCTRWWLYA
jgi:hypothetical protein